MSSKTTWSLVVAAGFLFALIFFVERPIRQAHLQQASRKLLPGLDAATVSSIVIRPANHLEIRAERQESGWRLTRPISYAADANRISALLRYLGQADWQDRIQAQELKTRPNALAEYGLVTPQSSIEIRDASSLWTVRIGTNSVVGDSVFLQVGGSEVIYLVSVDLLKNLPLSTDSWRDRELIALDQVPFNAVRIRSGGKTFELQRDAEALWHLNAASLSARADSAKVESLLQRLKSVQVRQFITDDPKTDLEVYGLHTSPQTPELELLFLKATNVLFAMQVGVSPTNSTDMAYVRRLSPGSVVLAPKEPFRPWEAPYTNLLDRHMISGPADRIQSIEVAGDDRFVLERQPDTSWNVRSGNEVFAADPELMTFVMEVLTNVETEVEQTVVAALERDNYGLAQPALQYAVRAASPNAIGTNLIAQIQFGANQSGRAFERRTDEPSVNSITPELFGRLPRVSWQMRDHRIWSFISSNVVSVIVQQKGGTMKLIRDPNQEWTFAPGSRGMLNAASLEETLHRLGELKAVYWDGIGDDPQDRFGFKETDHKIYLQVKTEDRAETLVIEFGKLSPYLHPYAAVMQNGRRWVFEFPAPLYNGGIKSDLTIAPAFRANSRR